MVPAGEVRLAHSEPQKGMAVITEEGLSPFLLPKLPMCYMRRAGSFLRFMNYERTGDQLRDQRANRGELSPHPAPVGLQSPWWPVGSWETLGNPTQHPKTKKKLGPLPLVASRS
jgi:hypothetical protein